MISNPEFMSKQILFVFSNSGDKISYSNDNIVVKNTEGKIKYQSSCYRLFIVFIVGNSIITSGLLQRAKKVWIFNLFDDVNDASLSGDYEQRRRQHVITKKTI